jgi:hypothetical protein
MRYSSIICKECLQTVLLLILSESTPEHPLTTSCSFAYSLAMNQYHQHLHGLGHIRPILTSQRECLIFKRWDLKPQIRWQQLTAMLPYSHMHFTEHNILCLKRSFEVFHALGGATSHHRNPEQSTRPSKWQFSSHRMFKTESSNFLIMR